MYKYTCINTSCSDYLQTVQYKLKPGQKVILTKDSGGYIAGDTATFATCNCPGCKEEMEYKGE
jgi:hypothetical protein